MKDQPTPETDAVFQKLYSGYSIHPATIDLQAAENHARNLERQRDEARADAQSARDIATEYGMRLDDAARQRDEALAQLAQARADDDRNNQLMVDLMRQRDDYHHKACDIADERDRAARQRDELLAALEVIPPTAFDYIPASTHKVIKAAIAAVKGVK